jgi:hypothetical protein
MPVLNLEETLAVRNEEKGGALYPLEPRELPFSDVGVQVRVLWPGEPNSLYHSEGVQEGFLVLWGECTLIVEEQNGICGSGTTSTVPPTPATCSSEPETDRASFSCSVGVPRSRGCATR